nr:hypothetical protein [Armatimonadota bacterium]NIO98664.1 hypothetical protein [Armatimonadota bacterium]
HPKDWKIAMGAGLLTEDEQKKLDYLEEAVELAPDEPAALFVLAGGRIERLMWYRFEEYYRSQEELSPDSEEELLATEMAELVREALNRLKQIDPDNAAPEALLAWLEFDEMRDTEALAHLRAAAGKTKWDLYGGALLQGYLQGSTRLEIPEFEAVGCENLWIALKSRFRELRELARVAEFIGQEAREAGRHEEAVEDWMSVIRLGRLMRYEGDRESEDLTGVSLEKIGAAPIYEWMAMDAAKQQGLTPVWEVAWKERDYRDDVMIPGGIFEGEHLDYFIEHAGAAAAADILDSLKQGEELRVEKSKYGVKPYNARFVDVLWAVLTQSLGIIMFGHMVFLLVLTILLWIVVRDRAQSVTRLRRFWVIILALIPLALILALWVGYSVRPVVMLFQDSIQMLVCRPSLGIVESNPGIIFASLPIMLLLGSLFAGVWIKRKSGGRHSWRAIFAGVLR